jgi:hypothetical protein
MSFVAHNYKLDHPCSICGRAPGVPRNEKRLAVVPGFSFLERNSMHGNETVVCVSCQKSRTDVSNEIMECLKDPSRKPWWQFWTKR